jgi:hypothetical protein
MTTQTTFRAARPTLLRRALQGNAIFSAITGAIMIFEAGPLATWLGLNLAVVLVAAGVILILYALGLFQLARGKSVVRRLVAAAIFLDLAWVAGSAIILLTGVLSLTVAGKWTVGLVADVVAVFAILQFLGLRELSNGP